MVWDQLAIETPQLVYLILGGFTSIFMLVSLFVKEKLYIGEATIAIIVGVIFGPHGADVINPRTWGNTDLITMEFSRVVLAIQCFAVGVELPRKYMGTHWKSLFLLLVPNMTFGWLTTGVFIWWMVPPFSWLDGLCVSACITATDPVLASSVVGKGKFARRIPKHLRDLISAESGCNDGMSFPFVYLAIYLIQYKMQASQVTYKWVLFTVLYECVFGLVFGLCIGWIARWAIKLASRHSLIDRDSFLAFYIVLALFGAGAGSLLGLDDLLVSFAIGVAFSNDGWFAEKTEESSVSTVIDLLLNLSFFVYLGTIVPWDQFNTPQFGIVPWRLIVMSIFVIFCRRIPIILAMKPLIPEFRTWREALFTGHFGPVGVGAIFVAILARAELQTKTTVPPAYMDPNDPNYNLIFAIWPIVTFIVVSSVIVHGSSVAVFTLGKRINTFNVTFSYTKENEQSTGWMTRMGTMIPPSRAASRADTIERTEEKLEAPEGELLPVGIPRLQLSRQQNEEDDRPPSVRDFGRRRKTSNRTIVGVGAGGPIAASAIAPVHGSNPDDQLDRSRSSTLINEPIGDNPSTIAFEVEQTNNRSRGDVSIYHSMYLNRDLEMGVPNPIQHPGHRDAPEGLASGDTAGHAVGTDDAPNVVEAAGGGSRAIDSPELSQLPEDIHYDHDCPECRQQFEEERAAAAAVVPATASTPVASPLNSPTRLETRFGDVLKTIKSYAYKARDSHAEEQRRPQRGAARAYQYGNTVVVEDEDGQVIRQFDLPKKEGDGVSKQIREGLGKLARRPSRNTRPHSADVPVRVGSVGSTPAAAAAAGSSRRNNSDDGLRLTVSHANTYGLTGWQKPRRDDQLTTVQSADKMNVSDFLHHVQQFDEDTKQSAHEHKHPSWFDGIRASTSRPSSWRSSWLGPYHRNTDSHHDALTTTNTNNNANINIHHDAAVDNRQERDSAPASSTVQVPDYFTSSQDGGGGRSRGSHRANSMNRAFDRIAFLRGRGGSGPAAGGARHHEDRIDENTGTENSSTAGETAAERRRRLAALGIVEHEYRNGNGTDNDINEHGNDDWDSTSEYSTDFYDSTEYQKRMSRMSRMSRT